MSNDSDDAVVELCEVSRISTGAQIREHIAPRFAAILDKLADLAEQGDSRSAEALLKYAPPPRPESEKFVIPGFAAARTLADKAACIERAVGSGAISFEAAEKAMRMVGITGQAVALDEVLRRLEAVEKGRLPHPGADFA